MVFICGILDTAVFYLYNDFTNGYFLRIGLLIFMSLLGIWYIKWSIQNSKENIKKSVYAKMAYTDPLTMKKNRRAFDLTIEEINNSDVKGTVVFVDINNLKIINDTLGHTEGDNAIIYVSNVIGDYEYLNFDIYRIGGDEFCVIIKNKSITEVEKVFVKINKRLESFSKEKEVNLSIAYGYSYFNKENNIQNAIIKSDENMYINKKMMKENE